jgi:hypothetical protein
MSRGTDPVPEPGGASTPLGGEEGVDVMAFLR